ncbi:MAG TPA: TonB-dependent receptor [Gemmatimonadaceae bacterium]|nr:TonB-dependent receptor [Gemmatimonadaceae bacterium]
MRGLGLGLLAGAVLYGTASAQAGTRRDTATVRRDTGAVVSDTGTHRDTARSASDTTPRDTIKAPLAHAPVPRLLGIGAQYQWDRDEMFATGAFNLADLLQLVPGVTVIRSGWLASPAQAAYLGDPAKVRIFYDGMELDPLNARDGPVLDLDAVQLWTLEGVTIERGADELRVYLRSWRVDRTTPSSRVDVATGDQNLNLYRGFYGKRFKQGEALQLAFQQFGSTGGKLLGGGDQLSLFGRVGWAHGLWSFDALGIRTNLTRDAQTTLDGGATIPELAGRRTDAYVRAAYGRPERGPWAQLMVASEEFDEHSSHDSSATPPDVADTVRTETQYVATAGVTHGPWRVSATSRTHRLESTTYTSVSERANVEYGPVAFSLAGEQRGPDSTSSESAQLRLTPLSFLAISGAVTHRHGGSIVAGSDHGIDARGELGLLLHRLWLTGGVMHRTGVVVPGLRVFDTSFVAMPATAATGLYGTIRGPIYKDLGVDLSGVRWTAPGFYRPQYQSRAELYLRTSWLSRFPRNNFGFLGSVAYEYRGTTLFPAAGASEQDVFAGPSAPFSHVLTWRIEIRIIDAILFAQQTFTIYPPQVQYVPGYLTPRQRTLYGVRWHFWN